VIESVILSAATWIILSLFINERMTNSQSYKTFFVATIIGAK